MIFLEVAHAPVVQTTSVGLFHVIGKWLTDVGAERRRKATLQSLLFAPEHRLRDLGISRDVLTELMDRRRLER